MPDVSENELNFSGCLVRIIRTAGEGANTKHFWVGMGFVIEASDKCLIMTCAHVVGDALNNRNLALEKTAPRGEFNVYFMNSQDVAMKRARVLQRPDAWSPMLEPEKRNTRGKTPQDIAILELVKDDAPPDILEAVFAPPNKYFDDDRLRAYGSPVGGVNAYENAGNYSTGRYQGINSRFIEFQATADTDSRFIREGCSGSPLWSSGHDGVLGMVTLAEKGRSVAWATPIKELGMAWKPLLKPSKALQRKNVDPAFCYIDRTYYAEAFEEIADILRDPAHGGTSRKPMLTAIVGARQEAHFVLRNRLLRDPIGKVGGDSLTLDPVAISWPREMRPESRYSALRKSLKRSLMADDTTDEALITAFNLRPATVLSLQIEPVAFTEEDTTILEEFLLGIQSLSDKEPGLTREVHVIISLVCEPDDGNCSLYKFSFSKLPEMLSDEAYDHDIIWQPLASVLRSDIDNWCDETLYRYGFQPTKDVDTLRSEVVDLFGDAESLPMLDLYNRIRDQGLTI